MTTPPPLTKLTTPAWSPYESPYEKWTPHETLTLRCGDHGHAYVATLKCGKRSCPSCRRREYSRLTSGYLDPLRSRRQPNKVLKFMTLTIPNIDVDDVHYLRDRVRFIRKAFNRLRRWKAYKSIIQAGLIGTELVNKTGHSWNLHIHVLYEGGYVLVCCQAMKDANTYRDIRHIERTKCRKCKLSRCLRRDWKKAAGGASVVHIKSIYCIKGGLEYICKYMTKPADVGGKTAVYDRVLKGFRVIQPFGGWFKIRLKPHSFACPECGCRVWLTDFQVEYLRQRAQVRSKDPPIIPVPINSNLSRGPTARGVRKSIIQKVASFVFSF